MTPLSRPVRPPTVDGRYELRDVLGTGGMARVYLAYDKRLERLVALKVLLPTFAAQVEYVERFRREALMLAMIESAYIVPVYDVCTESGVVYLVMRYFGGRTLERVLDEDGPFAPRAAARLMREVLAGLRVLHERQLVHRDLKPSNILVWDGGIVLLDLGIALDRRRAGLTRPGFVTGTPGFLAPEQMLGSSEHIDERVDLYQAGMLFSTLLGGTATGEAAGLIRRASAPLLERFSSVSEMASAMEKLAA